MLQVNPFTSAPQGVSYQSADAGAAAGGGAGASSGTGATGTGASAAGSGQGTGVAAVSITDDTPVTYGGKTYSSFKEYNSGFAPKSEVDSARNITNDQVKSAIAALAKAQAAGQNVNKTNPPTDPFAGVRDLAFVDGKTLEAMSKTALAPIAQAIYQLQQHVTNQNKTIQQLRGGVAPLAERHSSDEFQKRISTGISSALAGVDAKDPFVSELAQDVFHSYEWAKGKEDAEFSKYLGDRYKAAEAHFKAKFRADLDAAKTRKWQKPGGNATASGAAVSPFARATPHDIARNVFAGSGSNT